MKMIPPGLSGLIQIGEALYGHIEVAADHVEEALAKGFRYVEKTVFDVQSEAGPDPVEVVPDPETPAPDAPEAPVADQQ